MTKQEAIKEYNQANSGYNITGIKKTTMDDIQLSYKYNAHSLSELYSNPSDAKVSSYNDIIKAYAPAEIIAVQGSCHSYSVILKAGNGDYMHITKCNNYLLQLV